MIYMRVRSASADGHAILDLVRHWQMLIDHVWWCIDMHATHSGRIVGILSLNSAAVAGQRQPEILRTRKVEQVRTLLAPRKMTLTCTRGGYPVCWVAYIRSVEVL